MFFEFLQGRRGASKLARKLFATPKALLVHLLLRSGSEVLQFSVNVTNDNEDDGSVSKL